MGEPLPAHCGDIIETDPALALLDATVNVVADALLIPVTNALRHLLQQLVNQIGLALTGNANQQVRLAESVFY